jgi:hypothetical protein
MTENPLANLPETVFVLLVTAVPEERTLPPIPQPLVLQLEDDGPGYLVVLRSEEYAEEFRRGLDIQGLDLEEPAATKEVSLQELLRILSILEGNAEHVLIDPSPPDEWGLGEERGFTCPTGDFTSLLAEQLENN